MTTSHIPTRPATCRRKHLFIGTAVALITCFSLSACEDANNSAHPPREDLDSGWTCHVEGDVVRASGTITNHTSKPSFYVVETEFRFDGHAVDHRSATIDELAPGHTARVETVSSHMVDDGVTCHVSVDRFKA